MLQIWSFLGAVQTPRDSSRRIGIGETPQGDSPRRLTSRLRKARGVWTADLQEKVVLTMNESEWQFVEVSVSSDSLC